MGGKETKKKNKHHGSGSVYRRKSDGRWVVKYKPHNALNPIIKTASTKKDAQAVLKELKRLEVLGIQTSNQTVAYLMETWLETFRRYSLKPGSYDGEESNYLCHIKPTIGDCQCHQITAAMLQRLINDKGRELGYTALSKVYGLLTRFFLYILDEKIIEKNPMATVVMPQ